VTALALKWLQTCRISWSTQLAYKTNFVLLVVGPMLVFFFIRYNLWSAVFTLGRATTIKGYDLPTMLRYQGFVLVVSLLAQGMSNMQISEDIRLGRISAFLVYPFRFWQFHAASFLAFQTLQTLVAAATIGALRATGILPALALAPLLVGFAYCWLVGAVWFAVQFALGLASFWLEETWVLRAIFVTVSQFLSGAVLPLEVFPDGLRRALVYSPFPYLTWAPVRMFMGEYQGSVPAAFAVLALWLGFFAALAALVWHRGIRLYSAAGM
jgi:ABC-2 type transport system permease protein